LLDFKFCFSWVTPAFFIFEKTYMIPFDDFINQAQSILNPKAQQLAKETAEAIAVSPKREHFYQLLSQDTSFRAESIEDLASYLVQISKKSDLNEFYRLQNLWASAFDSVSYFENQSGSISQVDQNLGSAFEALSILIEPLFQIQTTNRLDKDTRDRLDVLKSEVQDKYKSLKEIRLLDFQVKAENFIQNIKNKRSDKK
jgi:hypothetical protein